jgi:hypothetical protein
MDQDTGRLAAELLELGEERVLRLSLPDRRPAMEDRWLAGLDRQSEVPAKVRELGEDRREDPVVVETGFADRGDLGVPGGCHDRRPVVIVDAIRVVGMDADRGIEPVEARGEIDGGRGRPGVPARDEDPLDTGDAGGPDDQLDVVVEAVGLEVAVAVDEAQTSGGWRRGTSASDLGERVPPHD